MNKQTISKEEKALIKSYVKYFAYKWENNIDEKDASDLEYELTGIIGNRNMEYRYAVEDFIKSLISNIK